MTLTVAPTSVFPTTAGQDVAIFPTVSECTVAQAAKFLGWSEGYVDEVLDDNLIKHRLKDGNRLIDWNSLQEYRQERERGLAALAEIVRWDQEMGLYDD
jgi:hypothetical protein